MPYVYLGIAIFAEVIGTSALKASDEFTKILPVLMVIAAYSISFYCLSLVLKAIPVGIAYAIWSGLGMVLVACIGAFYFKQLPDLPALIGMLLIITGVVVMTLFSKTLSL